MIEKQVDGTFMIPAGKKFIGEWCWFVYRYKKIFLGAVMSVEHYTILSTISFTCVMKANTFSFPEEIHFILLSFINGSHAK